MEKINIIKDKGITVQHGKDMKDEIKVSRSSFRIDKTANKDYVIYIDGNQRFVSNSVTIQDGFTGVPILLTPDNWIELTEDINELTGGVGGGAIAVPDEYFFVNDAARDSYFGANPSKLIEGVSVVSDGKLQQWKGGVWVDETAVIRGPKGDPGTSGTPGTPGAPGNDGVSSYVHVRWGDSDTPSTLLTTPDEYIGVYTGTSAIAPTTYSGYTWYKWKGEKGVKGDQGENGTSLLEYEQGKSYVTDSLVYSDDILYRVVSDFTSDNIETLVEESLDKDITVGHLRAVSSPVPDGEFVEIESSLPQELDTSLVFSQNNEISFNDKDGVRKALSLGKYEDNRILLSDVTVGMDLSGKKIVFDTTKQIQPGTGSTRIDLGTNKYLRFSNVSGGYIEFSDPQSTYLYAGGSWLAGHFIFPEGFEIESIQSVTPFQEEEPYLKLSDCYICDVEESIEVGDEGKHLRLQTCATTDYDDHITAKTPFGVKKLAYVEDIPNVPAPYVEPLDMSRIYVEGGVRVTKRLHELKVGDFVESVKFNTDLDAEAFIAALVADWISIDVHFFSVSQGTSYLYAISKGYGLRYTDMNGVDMAITTFVGPPFIWEPAAYNTHIVNGIASSITIVNNNAVDIEIFATMAGGAFVDLVEFTVIENKRWDNEQLLEEIRKLEGEIPEDVLLGVPGTYTQVSGTPADEFEFNDLQTLLDERINNRVFDGDVTVVMVADNDTDITLVRFIGTNPPFTSQLIIQSNYKIAKRLNALNCQGRVDVYGYGAVLCENFEIRGCNEFNFRGGNTTGGTDIGAATSIYTTMVAQTSQVAIAPDNGLKMICSQVPITVYHNASLSIVRNVELSQLVINNGYVINFSDEAQYATHPHSYGVCSDRYNPTNDTFQRNNLGIAGIYNQVNGTPNGHFEFDDLQEFLNTKINNRVFDDGVIINVNDPGSNPNVYFRNITLQGGYGSKSLYVNYLTGFEYSGGLISYEDINGYVITRFDSEGLMVGGHMFTRCGRVIVAGKASMERLDNDGCPGLNIGAAEDTHIVLPARTLTIRSGSYVTLVTQAPATICRIDMYALDNFGTLDIGKGCIANWDIITDRSQGLIIDNNAEHPQETFQRKGENTFTTVPDRNTYITVKQSTSASDTTIEWIATENGFVQFVTSAPPSNIFSMRAYINGVTDKRLLWNTGVNANAASTEWIYVEEGDVCTLEVDMGDLYQANSSIIYFCKPKIVWATTPAAKFNVNLIGQPDYANAESINRINSNNGTWTVDRDGYIRTQMLISYSNTIATNVDVTINGQIVRRTWTMGGLADVLVLQVSKGDIIKLSDSSGVVTGFFCYFIPPVSVAPMFVTEADLQTGTQPGEMVIDPITKIPSVIPFENEYIGYETAVPNTKYLGRQVYRQVIAATLPAGHLPGARDTHSLGQISGIHHIVDYRVVVYENGGNRFIAPHINLQSGLSLEPFITISGDLMLVVFNAPNSDNAQVLATVEYTKI